MAHDNPTRTIDIETNGLTPDRVWCVVMNDQTYGPDRIKEAVDSIAEEGSPLVFHNGISFDLPILKDLHGLEYDVTKVIDTAVLSRLYRCDREGGHSLAAWGEKLGTAKVPDLDWNVYDEGMLERCRVDVQITKKVHEALIAEAGDWDWSQAIEIEQRIAHYHQRQERNGVAFDVVKANEVADVIAEELRGIRLSLQARMPCVIKHNPNPTKPFVAAGGYAVVTKNHYGEDVLQVAGLFTKLDVHAPNINSDKQIKEFLFSIGWKPTEYNYKKDASGKIKRPLEKTSPKLSDDSLEPLGEVGKMFMRKGMLQHRLSMLRNDDGVRGLVNLVREDGRLTAGGIPCGTPTRRYTHKGVVNIPKAKESVPFGIDIRRCFIAKRGCKLIGSDADQLEARMDAHYTFPYDGGKRAAELLDGDIHQHNADIWGVSRDIAKNGAYCLAYGGQAAKLAQTLHVPKGKGSEYFDLFWDGNVALKRLKLAVEGALKKGYLKSLDGGKLFIRSEHSALNMLFQSAGSITVKLATILMNERLDAAGLDWKQVLHYHDEILIEIVDDYRQIEEAGHIIKQCWLDAGTMLKINVPITGDVQVGDNWAECH